MIKKLFAGCLAAALVLGCSGCDIQELIDLTEQISTTKPTEAAQTSRSLIEKQVDLLLEDIELPTTAAPVTVGAVKDWGVGRFYGANVAKAMMRRKSNPIALFHKLVNQGLYEKNYDKEGFSVEVPCDEDKVDQVFRAIPEVTPWAERDSNNPDYLLTEMLRMSYFGPSCSYLSSQLLTAYGNDDIFHYSDTADGNCYYNFNILTDDIISADVLAIYLPEPKDEESGFDTVEIQFLYLLSRRAGKAGFSIALEQNRQDWEGQTASVICALEKLMAGQSYLCRPEAYTGYEHDEFARYELPGSYELGDYEVEISYTDYECAYTIDDGGDYEAAWLVNYRIAKKGA